MVSSISLSVSFPNSLTAAVVESTDNWRWGSAFAASSIGLDGGVQTLMDGGRSTTYKLVGGPHTAYKFKPEIFCTFP